MAHVITISPGIEVSFRYLRFRLRYYSAEEGLVDLGYRRERRRNLAAQTLQEAGKVIEVYEKGEGE